MKSNTGGDSLGFSWLENIGLEVYRLGMFVSKCFAMHEYSFERLDIWKLAKDLSIHIYQLTKKFPDAERFGLTSQMTRCSISIASNIAEGSSRITKNDQSHFYTMAFSSTMELLNQLIISNELKFVTDEELLSSRLKIETITKGISSLKRSLNPKLLNP